MRVGILPEGQPIAQPAAGQPVEQPIPVAQAAIAAASPAAAALVPRDWSAMRDDYIARVKRRPRLLEETTKELVSSQAPAELLRKVTLAAVKEDGSALEYASPELRADHEIVLEAVKEDGSALKYADPELRKDPVIVLAAVKQAGYTLEYASQELRANRVFILEAVKVAVIFRIVVA